MNKKIISLQKHKLSKHPIIYTIEFVHDSDGMSFTVYDVKDTKKDRLAVAIDLEAAAASLRED